MYNADTCSYATWTVYDGCTLRNATHTFVSVCVGIYRVTWTNFYKRIFLNNCVTRFSAKIYFLFFTRNTLLEIALICLLCCVTVNNSNCMCARKPILAGVASFFGKTLHLPKLSYCRTTHKLPDVLSHASGFVVWRARDTVLHCCWPGGVSLKEQYLQDS